MLKDTLFPPRCPICGDVIPFENRMKLHRIMSGERIRRKEPMGTGADRGGTEALPAGDKTEKRHRAEGLMKASETRFAAVMCRGCRSIPPYITEPRCRKCGKQLNRDVTDGLCRDCASNERMFEACRCVMTYDETFREIMAGLKYASRKE